MGKFTKDKRRCEKLDTIIKKLYESYAVGRIGEERFDTLLTGYEQEQTALWQSVTEAEAALDSFEQDTANVERFLALAKKYTDFSELTTPMINEFIEKIIVHAPEKVDGDRLPCTGIGSRAGNATRSDVKYCCKACQRKAHSKMRYRQKQAE